jgi:hypothetical protein
MSAKYSGIKLPILALSLFAVVGLGVDAQADPAPVTGLVAAPHSVDAARMRAAAAAQTRADGVNTSPGYQEPVRSQARASAKSQAAALPFKSLSDIAASK